MIVAPENRAKVSLGLIVMMSLSFNAYALPWETQKPDFYLHASQEDRECERIMNSLEVFAQRDLPSVVRLAKEKGWDSDETLDVIEKRLKHCISIHSDSSSYHGFERAVDLFLPYLRESVQITPNEADRRTLLLSNDGILLARVKPKFVGWITKLALESNHRDEQQLMTQTAEAVKTVGHSEIEAEPQSPVLSDTDRSSVLLGNSVSIVPSNQNGMNRWVTLNDPKVVNSKLLFSGTELPRTVADTPATHREGANQRSGSEVNLASNADHSVARPVETYSIGESISLGGSKMHERSDHSSSALDGRNSLQQTQAYSVEQSNNPFSNEFEDPAKVVSQSGWISVDDLSLVHMQTSDSQLDETVSSPVSASDMRHGAEVIVPPIPEISAAQSMHELQHETNETMEYHFPDSMNFQSATSLEKKPYLSQVIDKIPPTDRSRFRLFKWNIFAKDDSYPMIDGKELLGGYQAQAKSYQAPIKLPDVAQPPSIPGEYRAWWHESVTQPLNEPARQFVPIDVESLVLLSMQYSPHIASLKIDPSIRETNIVEEDAEFDWMAFVESSYDRLNEPWVWNNSLSAGTIPGFVAGADGNRLKSDQLNARAGIRRVSRKGTEFEVFQDFNSLSNNQPFLSPNPANTARLELSLTKPLLKGHGVAVNQSRIVLAELNRDINGYEVTEQIEDHISEVHKAFWSLYQHRASLLQKQKLLAKGEKLLQILEARESVDATQSQIMRTRSVVAKRRAEMPSLTAAVMNSQADLRLLVNSPSLKGKMHVELLPFDAPSNSRFPVSMQDSLQTALIKRADIAAAIKQIHSTSVQLEVSKNELLPRFDLDFRMYTAGIQTDRRSSFGDQFSSSGPGVGVGVIFELPIGNRKANAVKQRRELILSKAFKEFEIVVESGLVETEQAVRQVESTYAEMLASYDSMNQATAETAYAERRWQTVTVDGSSMQLLDALFDSQDRTSEGELQFVSSQIRYELAIMNLKRALGLLLSSSDTSF